VTEKIIGVGGRHFDILSPVDLEIKNTITLTSVLSRRGRGSKTGKYIPYNNSPFTCGRELKGGGD